MPDSSTARYADIAHRNTSVCSAVLWAFFAFRRRPSSTLFPFTTLLQSVAFFASLRLCGISERRARQNLRGPAACQTVALQDTPTLRIEILLYVRQSSGLSLRSGADRAPLSFPSRRSYNLLPSLRLCVSAVYLKGAPGRIFAG